MKVLVIDDDVVDQEAIYRALRNYPDMKIEYAENSVEALIAIECHDFDCILLDYLLPECNGIELLNQVNQISESPLPPVIMLTGQGNEKVAVEAMKFGVYDYITKNDFTPESIYTLISDAIKHRIDREKAKQLQTDIELASLRDPKTSLGNQYLFHNDFDLAVNKYKANSHAFTVILIRLINFDQILVQHGEKTFEQALKIFANRLRAYRSTDHYYRHYNGDFYGILPNIGDTQKALEFTQKMYAALMANIKVADCEIRFSFAIAYAIYPFDGITREDITHTLIESIQHSQVYH